MKVKTSLTLSEDVLSALDRLVRKGESRSALIDRVLREFIDGVAQTRREARSRRRQPAGGASLRRNAGRALLPGARHGRVRRGDLYRVRRPPGDPKPARAFVVVSRQPILDAKFPTAICAPVFSARSGLPTEVAVGPAEGLKLDSAIHCDSLISIDKARLEDLVGALSPAKLKELNAALSAALAL